MTLTRAIQRLNAQAKRAGQPAPFPPRVRKALEIEADRLQEDEGLPAHEAESRAAQHFLSMIEEDLAQIETAIGIR